MNISSRLSKLEEQANGGNKVAIVLRGEEGKIISVLTGGRTLTGDSATQAIERATVRVEIGPTLWTPN